MSRAKPNKGADYSGGIHIEFIVVGISALVVSGLTVFSGFGLGTLLLPVFALFFPVELAVATTAIVHAANSALKLPLFAGKANWSIIKRFGIPAIIFSFPGAVLLKRVSVVKPLAAYKIGSHIAQITPIKLVIAFVILFFAVLELLPRFQKVKLNPRYLPFGGALSGFFGGLSGHQGAFRSVFFAASGLSTEEFVGTTAVTAFLVDLVRLAVYGSDIAAQSIFPQGNYPGWGLIGTAIGSAFIGMLLSRRYLARVTMKMIKTLVGILLIIIALLLGSGLI